MSELTEANAKWLEDLQDLVDFLRFNQELINPYSALNIHNFIYPKGDTDEEVRADALEQMRPLVRQLKFGLPTGSPDIQKVDSDYYYGFDRKFGSHYIQVVTASTGTCRYEPTGETETKTRVEIPDEVLAQYTVTEEVPVMEKVCPSLFKES